MKNYLKAVTGTITLAMIVAGFLAVGVMNAGALDSNGNDWGPPPEAPHFETVNDVSNLCIDPPGEAWMVIHTDTNGVLSQTDPFLYYPNDDAVILHDTPHKCIPMDPPVCPEDAQVDQHIEMWATWDIGTGDSPRLVIDLECTPEIVPPTDPPVVTDPPVELAPPVVQTAVDPSTPLLAETGAGETVALVAFALSVIAIGFSMVRNAKVKATRGLR